MSSRRSRSGRHGQLHHVQPVKQVLAETAGFDFLLQVAVGRGEDAGVDVDFGVRADSLETSVLRDAQEFGLKLLGHVGDFIEENRAAVGHLKAADALGDGAGKGALFVSKKFALQQGFGNGGAVDLDKLSRATGCSSCG